jgi:site-specific recombinase XerD
MNDIMRALFIHYRTKQKKRMIDNLRYLINGILKRADIKKRIPSHKLCHIYDTPMMNNGTPLEVIQNLLEHKSIPKAQSIELGRKLITYF